MSEPGRYRLDRAEAVSAERLPVLAWASSCGMNRAQPVSGRDFMDLKAHIRHIANFPKPGILFYDISTLLQRPDAFQVAIDRMADLVSPHRPERLIGVESRGFVFAAPLALRLGVGFAMVRKRGKLPGSVVGHAYNLEYGDDTIEISSDLIPARSRVVVVDDLIATGGTAAATIELLDKIDAEVAAAIFLIELAGLNGRERLRVPVASVLTYDR